MSCLHPIWIRVDRRGTNPLPYCSDRYKRFYYSRSVAKGLGISQCSNTKADFSPSLQDLVPVPCGKCIECLKARQNAMVSRVLAESEKRGSMQFVTLTYDDEHLPLAQSLWKVDKETGDYICVDKGEVIVSGRSSRLSGRQKDFQDIQDSVRKYFFSHADKASPLPRYVERPVNFGFGELADELDYEFRERITPSVCRKDVRLWLKSARLAYERENGVKMDNFSYVAVSEFGPNTCRPHYHLAFFGLLSSQVAWLVSRWKYGFTLTKSVKRVNPDGSNGFQIAARYIGKYMTKGKFDSDSVKDGSAEKPRVCQSRGIGASLIDKIRPFMCAFDMFGSYDLNTFFCPSLGRCLNENELNQLVNEIPHRLYYDVGNGYKLPVPRLFRQKVFFERKAQIVRRNRFVQVSGSSEFRPIQRDETKISYMPSALWAMVSATIRDNLSRNASAEFQQYLLRDPSRPLHDACCNFAYYEESCTKIKEDVAEATYINFLKSSVF